jgi:hypothetical protein
VPDFVYLVKKGEVQIFEKVILKVCKSSDLKDLEKPLKKEKIIKVTLHY